VRGGAPFGGPNPTFDLGDGYAADGQVMSIGKQLEEDIADLRLSAQMRDEHRRVEKVGAQG
jgi:hypothetical protein